MITPRRPWLTDDPDDGRLSVFVPGAMGAGLLLSLGILVADAYRKVGGDRLAARRTRALAHAAATDVVVGPGASLRAPRGRRHAATYTVLATIWFGLAAWVTVGATWNYFNPIGYARGVAWLWAAGVLSGALFLRVGFMVALAVPRSLPWIIAATGAGLTLRFTQLADGGLAILLVAIVGLAVTGSVTTVMRRFARGVSALPAWVWPLYIATPLLRHVTDQGPDPR